MQKNLSCSKSVNVFMSIAKKKKDISLEDESCDICSSENLFTERFLRTNAHSLGFRVL